MASIELDDLKIGRMPGIGPIVGTCMVQAAIIQLEERSPERPAILLDSPEHGPRGRVVSVRARAAARRFALATLLALSCAGEVRAAAVCSDTPGPNDRVYCAAAALTNVDIDIALTNQIIATTRANEVGVYAVQSRRHG